MGRRLTEYEYNALLEFGEGPPLYIPPYAVINTQEGPIVYLPEEELNGDR